MRTTGAPEPRFRGAGQSCDLVVAFSSAPGQACARTIPIQQRRGAGQHAWPKRFAETDRQGPNQ